MRIRLASLALILSVPLVIHATPLMDRGASNSLFELNAPVSVSEEAPAPIQPRSFVETLEFLLTNSIYDLIPSDVEIQVSSLKQEIREITRNLTAAQVD